MVSLLARALLLTGSLVLAGSLGPVRQMLQRLPAGTVRTRWYTLTALIGLFLMGYLGYTLAFWNRHANLSDLIVPGVFFFGACFVWLTATLALHTAIDVRRTTLLELENVTDPLTGIFNRRYLDRRLRDEVLRARRYGAPLSLVFLDIDHFKRINDAHGHAAGDQILTELSTLLAGALRETDVLTRYGGEEFVLLIPHTSLEGATEIAERLLRTIEDHPFNLLRIFTTLRITCSAGVASLAECAGSPEDLLQMADERLYRAKTTGRNRVVATAPPGLMVAEAQRIRID